MTAGFDKILLVTGEPRSGTSLMMQTLAALGIPVAGEGEIERKPILQRDHRRAERAQDLNPHGFYEVPGVVVRGLKTNAERFYGQALKVIVSGVVRTPLEHVSRIILCLRDPREIAVSQSRLVSEVSVAAPGGGWEYSPSAMKISPDRYLRRMGSFALWILAQVEAWDWRRVLTMDYSEMMTDPEGAYVKIAHFAGVEPVGKPVVDAQLYRSNPAEWDDDDGYLAVRLYRALKDHDLSFVQEDLHAWLKTDALEHVTWIDDFEFETWLVMGPSMYRSMKSNNKGLRDKLKPGLVPTKCRYFSYSQRPQDVYTVARPTDIGDMVRPKVLCGRPNKDGLKTAVECLKCWKSGEVES